MKKTLNYISISHKTASITQREIYQISETEKQHLSRLIPEVFPDISGLLMLITCNRTELYFESSSTSAATLRDFFLAQKVKDKTIANPQLFELSDSSATTARHLMEVAAGLESSVLGDAEIIHQIKKAHLFSLSKHMQGSILERAMQAVFKCHKRINNETHFRDGTTSLAYKTLKLVNNHIKTFSKDSNKILFVGAGDIVMQLFKYNSKFNFDNIYLSNRTKERAKTIAKNQQCKLYNWNKIIENDFEDFDVIISAVSNCHHLIKNVKAKHKKILLIDLAVPTNIDKTLAKTKNIIYCGLDSISEELENNIESRMNAKELVIFIIAEELSDYMEWLKEAAFREWLTIQKQFLNSKIRNHFDSIESESSEEIIKIVANRILKKIIKRSDISLSAEEIDTILFEQLALLTETHA